VISIIQHCCVKLPINAITKCLRCWWRFVTSSPVGGGRMSLVDRTNPVGRSFAFPSVHNHGRSDDITIDISLSLSPSLHCKSRVGSAAAISISLYPYTPDRVLQINEVNLGRLNEQRRQRCSSLIKWATTCCRFLDAEWRSTPRDYVEAATAALARTSARGPPPAPSHSPWKRNFDLVSARMRRISACLRRSRRFHENKWN